MYVHFKRDLLENQNYNYFNILLYIAIFFLFDFHPRNFLKIAPINIAMVIFTNIPYIQTRLSGYPFCSMCVMLTVKPLKNYASLSLIAFANSKDSDKPVLKCSAIIYKVWKYI